MKLCARGEAPAGTAWARGFGAQACDRVDGRASFGRREVAARLGRAALRRARAWLSPFACGCLLAACSGEIGAAGGVVSGDAGDSPSEAPRPPAARPPDDPADAASAVPTEPPRVEPAPSPSPEAGTGGERPPPVAVCDGFTEVLAASCGNGSCHSNPGVAIGDFAVSPERAAAFVDRPSARNAACGLIIDSRDYGQSLLLTKITGRLPSDDCGGAMPIGSFIITEAQVDCLASWLQQFQR